MSINKFITNLDLARQAEIMSGETAVFQGGIELGIPFSGFPSGVDTSTIVSLGIVGAEFAAFSGNTGTTVFNVTDPSSPYYSVSATTLSASPYTIIDSDSITETVSATTYPTIMTFTALSGDCCSTPINVSFTPPIIQELYDRGLYDGLFNGLGQATIGTTYIDESFYNVGSVFSGANLNMEIVEYGVHGTTPAWVTGTTSGTVIEYSALTQYWSDPIYENLTSGLTLPITPESADTQTSNYVWTLTDSTIIDENIVGLQYTGYSVTYSFNDVIIDPESPSITGGVTGATSADTYYLGTVTATLENYSAGTLDYKGSTNWLIVNGSATIDERLTTDRLTIHTLGTGSPVTMLGVDVNGNVVGGSGSTTDDTGAFTSTTANNTIIPTNAAGNTNDSDYASILAGQNNTISGTSTSSAIVGGENNVVKDVSNYSIIAGGSSNNIFDTTNAGIFAGTNNVINDADYGVILGGMDNTMENTATYSAIIGGNQAIIDKNEHSIILGGELNKIGSSKTSIWNAILGGYNNVMSGTNSSYASVMLGGHSNTMANVGSVDKSFMIAGNQNTYTSGSYGGILGGRFNTMSGLSNSYSVIIAGANNIIKNGATYSAILAGSDNTLQAGDYNIVIGGQGNTMDSNGDDRSAIIAGSGNTISNGSNESNAIIAGIGNSLNAGAGTTIVGGFNNTIEFGAQDYCSIIGGQNNLINAVADRSVIIGGQNITASTSDTVYVPNLNITTLGTGTSVTNLGIDSSGNVVSGSTGGGTSYWSAGTGTNAIVMINGGNTSSGTLSTAKGSGTTASGDYAHAEGDRTDATGIASHAEGRFSNASGDYAHAEGFNTDATGNASHAEGQSSLASGNYSHAEGIQTEATNTGSHSEGTYSLASGIGSHAQNRYTIAAGDYSHAGGYGNDITDRVVASGETSFAHMYVQNNEGYLGVYGDNSSILGGINHNIDSASTSSSILGGNNNRIVGATGTTILGGQNITGTTDDTVYVPNLEVSGGITSSGIPSYADDTAAGVGGLTTGQFYQTDGTGASPLNVAGILMIKQ